MAESRIPVNDAHVHIGRSSGIYRTMSPSDLMKLRNRHNLGNVMVMGFEQDVEEGNRQVMELAGRHGFIWGLLWIQKYRLQQDAFLLEKLLKNGSGIVGAKFHGSYENSPVSSPVYEPVMQVLNEKKAILLLHTGRYKDASRESNTSYLHGIDVAKKYPKIKVLFAHMGGSDTSVVKRALNDAKDIPNIYFDTSGITTPYAIEYAVRVIDVRRILFGSDEPWCSFRSMYYNIVDAEVPNEYKERILSENFKDLVVKSEVVRELVAS